MGSDFNLIPLTQIELVHVIQQQGHTVTVTLPLSLSLAQAGHTQTQIGLVCNKSAPDASSTSHLVGCRH